MKNVAIYSSLILLERNRTCPWIMKDSWRVHIQRTFFSLINMNYSVPFHFNFAYAGVITPAEDSYARHLLVASMVSDEWMQAGALILSFFSFYLIVVWFIWYIRRIYPHVYFYFYFFSIAYVSWAGAYHCHEGFLFYFLYCFGDFELNAEIDSRMGWRHHCIVAWMLWIAAITPLVSWVAMRGARDAYREEFKRKENR
jgi:hypothetical protein